MHCKHCIKIYDFFNETLHYIPTLMIGDMNLSLCKILQCSADSASVSVTDELLKNHNYL